MPSEFVKPCFSAEAGSATTFPVASRFPMWHDFRGCFVNKKLCFVLAALTAIPVAFTRAGEIASAGSSASESDYGERKRILLICKQRGSWCGAKNAGRKLLLQTDTGRSQFWPAG